MKLKFVLIGLVGFAASSLVTLAQTAAPAGDTNQPAAAAPAAATPTPAPAPAPAAAPEVPAAAPAPVAAPAPAAPDTSAAPVVPRDPNSVMPLFLMKDTALTVAIENLARQASLNYMLDPNIPFLKPGPDGHSQEPVISLRLENVTADQALAALLNNYNLQLQEDPKTKISRITVKDPAAPDPLVTKIIQLKYADPTNLLANVQSVLQDKRSRVVSDVRTSQLVLTATEKEVVAVDELVTRLDTKTPEVLIEAKLVETSKNPTSTHGIDWTATLQAQHMTFGNGITTGNVINSSGTASGSSTGTGVTGQPGTPFAAPDALPAASGTTTGSAVSQVLNTVIGGGGLSLNTAHGFSPQTAFLNADGAAAVLSFLNTAADAKVLSTPRAVTQDNHEAVLSVTETFPIFQTTAGTLGSLGGTTVTYTNIGTILHVTPRISANETISLNVLPEVSSFNSTVTKTVGGLVNQADVFDERKIDTRVLIPSGNTLVMGGLINDNQTKGATKVPIMGDLPVLGWAFRHEAKTQNKKNLLIFITPTIVRDEDFQPTQTDFLKTKYDGTPTADFGAWDSGEKENWSSLRHNKSSSESD